MKNTKKYSRFDAPLLSRRLWPDQKLNAAPIWCSVDLRDGNQSLAVPMNVEQKLELFKTLVKVGFKEIEVGFPAASQTDFDFVRMLIEGKHIPNGVTIQVLTQAREDLIKRTVQSLVGAKKVIIHLYNSTSPAQRDIVFKKSKGEILQLALSGVRWIKHHAKRLKKTDVRLEYSPESFSQTEIDFSILICRAVVETWKPTKERKIILNLPSTVEVSMPNVYADQIETFISHLNHRDCVIVSLHTHNDRGTGMAATELGLLAGADRVEGTLFGNGERTGNLDIVTAALNLYMHGIDPKLDFSDINAVRKAYEKTTAMTVSSRHPYSGELVFSAFSGSHQDAIRKGLEHRKKSHGSWQVPYLTIDPKDIGRKYREVIRVNGQSGKGGVAHLLESAGIIIPKEMQREFGPIAKVKIDMLGREMASSDIKQMFWEEYVTAQGKYELESFNARLSRRHISCRSEIIQAGQSVRMTGKGNGPIAAFVNALKVSLKLKVEVVDYAEHTLGRSSKASAIAYVCLRFNDGTTGWGAAVDKSIELAPIRAVVSALNRKHR